jgi:hypothetical protein
MLPMATWSGLRLLEDGVRARCTAAIIRSLPMTMMREQSLRATRCTPRLPSA